MNLQEYLNQEDPKRLPDFSVSVKREELAAIWKTPKGYNVQLSICNDHFTYHCFSEQLTGYLYTLDLQPTVFRIID